ncbi:hypothetical protein ACFOGI_14280 [Virgibacillus xinjiangensis]|uniref:Sporulation protein YhaL n=1 Tax=Virgibacillus xinjiangensis TaxID=393090 RepID=A0ABV7CYD9_9BACI
MMPFLYFPEDKSEYLPAILTLTLFIILAIGAMYLFYKNSKKEERRFNEKYRDEIRYAEENDELYENK